MITDTENSDIKMNFRPGPYRLTIGPKAGWQSNGRVLSFLNGLYLHDHFFEFLVGNDGFVFDLAFICIDGIYGIAQDGRNLLCIMNTHPDQRKNAKVGIEQFPFLQFNLAFLIDQGIEFGSEIREKP